MSDDFKSKLNARLSVGYGMHAHSALTHKDLLAQINSTLGQQQQQQQQPPPQSLPQQQQQQQPSNDHQQPQQQEILRNSSPPLVTATTPTTMPTTHHHQPQQPQQPIHHHHHHNRASLKASNTMSITDTPQVFGKSLDLLMQRRDHVDCGEKVPKIIRLAANSLYNHTFTVRLSNNRNSLAPPNNSNNNNSYPNQSSTSTSSSGRWLGLKVDGIFRESGSAMRLQEMRELFDRGPDAIEELTRMQYVNNVFDLEDPHVTANMIKLYLRLLPEPVMTFGAYDRIIRLVHSMDSSSSSGNDASLTGANRLHFVQEVKQMLRELPPHNEKLLNTVLFLLYECHTVNDRMKASNLGIVFGVNLFRSPSQQQNGGGGGGGGETEHTHAHNIQYLNRATQWLIELYHEFFTGTEPYLFTIYQPLLRRRVILQSCVNELEKESRSPMVVAQRANSEYVYHVNPLYEGEVDPQDLANSQQQQNKSRQQNSGGSGKGQAAVTEENNNASRAVNASLLSRLSNMKNSNKESKMSDNNSSSSSRSNNNNTTTNVGSVRSGSGGLEPLKWTVSASAIDDAIVDFRTLVDGVQDASLRKKLEEVYARIFYSVYYVDQEQQQQQQSGTEDDDDDGGPQAYAVMLQEREDQWLRERNRLTNELDTLRNESNSKLIHAKRSLQRLLEELEQ